MKRLILLTALFTLPLHFSWIHATETGTDYRVSPRQTSGSVEIRRGDNLEKKLPSDVLYLLPDFADALVKTTDGSVLSGKINLFIPNHTLRIIAENGDTLEAVGTEMISSIHAGETTIHHIEDCFLPELAESNGAILSEIHRLTIEYEPLAQEDTTDSVRPVKRILYFAVSGNDLWKFDVDVPTEDNRSPEDEVFIMTYSLTTEYVLAKDGKIYPADRLSSFLKVFPKDKAAVRALATNFRTNFTNRESLIGLFEYCSEL